MNDHVQVNLYELCICILCHDFNQSDSVFYMHGFIFLRWWKSFFCYIFMSIRGYSLLWSKCQSFRNTFSCIKVRFEWSISLALNMISNGESSDPLCDSDNRGVTLVRLTKSYWWLLTHTEHLCVSCLFCVSVYFI